MWYFDSKFDLRDLIPRVNVNGSTQILIYMMDLTLRSEIGSSESNSPLIKIYSKFYKNKFNIYWDEKYILKTH